VILVTDRTISGPDVDRMASAIGARVEYRSGEVLVTRRPTKAQALAHYRHMQEQALAEALQAVAP